MCTPGLVPATGSSVRFLREMPSPVQFLSNSQPVPAQPPPGRRKLSKSSQSRLRLPSSWAHGALLPWSCSSRVRVPLPLPLPPVRRLSSISTPGTPDRLTLRPNYSNFSHQLCPGPTVWTTHHGWLRLKSPVCRGTLLATIWRKEATPFINHLLTSSSNLYGQRNLHNTVYEVVHDGLFLILKESRIVYLRPFYKKPFPSPPPS